jgi:PAS domain S-box-containing protein
VRPLVPEEASWRSRRGAQPPAVSQAGPVASLASSQEFELAASASEWDGAQDRHPGPSPLLVPALVCATGLFLWTLPGWAALLARRWLGDSEALAALVPCGQTLLVLGLVLGLWRALQLQRQLRAASAREQRLSHLLQQASDGHWELDAEFRLIGVQSKKHTAPAGHDPYGLGHVPWEHPRLVWAEETLDQLRAHLELREPLRDLPVQVRGSAHSALHLLVSGAPRFSARGQFLGYGGVARDVSAAHHTRSALQASESRYRELFALSPTALVLHRQGRVVGANPAALQLLGHSSLLALQQTNLIDYFEEPQPPEQALARLAPTPRSSGAAAAAAPQPTLNDLCLRVAGRRVWVRTAGVAVHSEHGPAVMTLLIDDTERRTAEEAVRRSEALLSLVFSTSPDLITLSELTSGRYQMVNRSFEQLLGWTAQEALGRTALELGVWPSEQARRQFVRAVLDQGLVSEMAVTFINKAGKPVPLRVSAARLTNERQDYIVVNARDISASERERLEREAILANASVGIALVREQRFALVNRHFESLVAWPAGTLLGQALGSVWPQPEQAAAAPPSSAQHETELLRRDGSRFLARIRTHPIDPHNPHEGGRVFIVEDITEQRQFEQTLQRARTEAEAASRAKSAFLANTSHELRTPLNAIAGLAALACEPQTSESARRAYLSQLTVSVKALAATVTGILDFSQITAGQVQIKAEIFDLQPMLGELHSAWLPAAQAKSLRLHSDLDASAARVRGDAHRLRQVLQHLLANAIKFTARGEVGLRVYRKGASALMRFEVRDTGPGIAPGQREGMFQPFSQADVSHTRQHGGTGLGLPTSRELVKLMGGHMGMQDAVPGQPSSGSLFWVELPLPVAQQPLPAASAAAAGLEEGTVGSATGSLKGLRVLMADDNEVNRLVACATLEQWGVQVVQVSDGAQAVAAVARASRTPPEGPAFDAVLMDLQMPVMSGFDATRAIRARADSQRLPIIALTAAALETERAQALAAGMNDFITKPIDAERLRAAMLHWCGREPKTLPLAGA